VYEQTALSVQSFFPHLLAEPVEYLLVALHDLPRVFRDIRVSDRSCGIFCIEIFLYILFTVRLEFGRDPLVF